MEVEFQMEQVEYFHIRSGLDRKSYNPVNLVLKKGRILAVAGKVPGEKSLFLSMAAGRVKPEMGKVLWEGKDIQKADVKVGYMERWKEPNQDRQVYIQSDPLFQLESHTCFWWKKQQKEGNEDEAGWDFAKKYFGKEELLVLDEPFYGLSCKARMAAVEMTRKLVKKENKIMILSSEDLSITMPFADEVLVLSGKSEPVQIPINLDFWEMEEKKPEKIRHNPDLKTYFEWIREELNAG